MIIDFHTHLGVDLCEDFAQTPAELLSRLDEAGVDQSVVFAFGGCPDWEAGNDTVAAAARRHPDRLIPFLTVNPGEVPVARRPELARSVATRVESEGWRGIVLHPMMHNYLISHPLLKELCSTLGRDGYPVVIHLLSQWVDETSALPGLLAACPNTNFIVPSVYWNAGGMDLLTSFPNVYFDLSKGYARITTQPLLAAVGAERLLFGSESPMGSPRLELEKLHASGLADAAERLVLAGNASRLLHRPAPASSGRNDQ